MKETNKETVVAYKATRKSVRKLGYDLGYGITMGIFSATFVTSMLIGVVKAVYRHSNKPAEKVDSAEEVKEETGGTEEA